MKKIISILILIAFLSTASLQNPTFATSTSREIWTIPELIEMKTESDREMDELCHEDQSCEEGLHSSRLENRGRNLAIENFSNMTLIITSINPSNSIVRVLFHDEDQMLRQFFGTRQHAILDELYIAWFSSRPEIYNRDYALYGNYPDGMYYPLFAGSSATNGSDWITPNIEVELNIEDASVLYNSPYLIYFTMEADITNVSGIHDYGDCMNSPLYEEGMECRMVFDDAGGFFFLPFLPGAETPVFYPLSEETLIDKNTTSEIGSQETSISPSSADSLETEKENSSTNSLGNSDASSSSATKTVNPTIPNTGASIYPFKNHIKKVDLPWWIIVLVVLGGAFLVWLFTPNSKKPPKNS